MSSRIHGVVAEAQASVVVFLEEEQERDGCASWTVRTKLESIHIATTDRPSPLLGRITSVDEPLPIPIHIQSR